jgi:hypothetical protein
MIEVWRAGSTVDQGLAGYIPLYASPAVPTS